MLFSPWQPLPPVKTDLSRVTPARMETELATTAPLLATPGNQQIAQPQTEAKRPHVFGSQMF